METSCKKEEKIHYKSYSTDLKEIQSKTACWSWTWVASPRDLTRAKVLTTADRSDYSIETRRTDQRPELYRRPGLVDPIAEGPGKPVNIELHIGRKPILAVGNADGDIHMLWYSEASGYRSL